MKAKLLHLLQSYKDLIPYMLFGVLTTAANYAVYLPLYNMTALPATWCNAFAWAVSVAFAFLTNKPFVFKSRDWSRQVVLPELGKFVGCRLGSGALETVGLLIFVDLMDMDGNFWKIVLSIVVIILNYVGSKWLVFGGKNEG